MVGQLTVLLWQVAICLVDIVIQAISDTLFLPITANNLVQAGVNGDQPGDGELRGNDLAEVRPGCCRIRNYACFR
jgi:hypothetical protein